LGVIVRTCRQTPRFWGAPGIGTCRWRRLFQFLRIAGALIFLIAGFRPWRTSWLIVGTKTLSFRFLTEVVDDPSPPSADPVDPQIDGRWFGLSRVGWPLTGVLDAGAETDPSRGHEGGWY
jgi:hypothetical protein